ncbi:MAG: low specificity L-threonine aldolase [Rhodobacteraceae bacterium]|nr:low specificity L-threonine aldolase [Paracoccaceae bacterium]
MYFASDNSSGVAPEILAAVTAANPGYAPSYGTDPVMDRVRARIRDLFEAPEAAVYLVATGTAANALSLAVLVEPWQTVYCHRLAHIEQDECGAPEFFTGGAKLVLVDGENAKMTPETLRARIAATRKGDVHGVQRGAVSITNVTELGSVYSADELRALTGVAREYGLPVHLDGARFANAVVATGASPAELSWKSGVDVLSFGGTKNGCMGVEAVVIFDPRRAWEFELRRKRGAHLFSKHRYLSAQMDAYLTDGLWLSLAGRANAMADRLKAGLATVPGAAITHPADANVIFAAWPRALHRHALGAGARYYQVPGDPDPEGPDDAVIGARLVTSWSTTEEDVDRFLALIRGQD